PSLPSASFSPAAAPVEGAALVVTLADAEPADGERRRADDGRVYDQDLQVLVNALWAAGARAIGINGQRMTPTTAIRTAGEAILVDYRPLSGPYEVTALGDRDRLEDVLRASAAGRRLQALEDRFGIRYETRRTGRARLPAAGVLQLRHARAQGEGTRRP
ncbi:DUF881 domain-containing protein, partial [Actinomadura fulvescens]|uniref:DUF881 domain-containing protein n=1 Tax=Actinomadura fulvescens TaxID=46160 RepID=UPI00397CDE04